MLKAFGLVLVLIILPQVLQVNHHFNLVHLFSFAGEVFLFFNDVGLRPQKNEIDWPHDDNNLLCY